MRSIETMNEIGRERRRLLDSIHFRGRIRVGDVHALNGRHDLLALRLAVGLYDGQAERRRPHDGGHLFFPDTVLGRWSSTARTPFWSLQCVWDSLSWYRFRDQTGAKI
jgi:hypothetical protein